MPHYHLMCGQWGNKRKGLGVGVGVGTTMDMGGDWEGGESSLRGVGLVKIPSRPTKHEMWLNTPPAKPLRLLSLYNQCEIYRKVIRAKTVEGHSSG